jgi:hypothetical protein
MLDSTGPCASRASSTSLEGLVMLAFRSRGIPLLTFAACAATLAATLAGDALAAKSRIVRPETDAVTAPKARATLVTPVLNAMRETAPGSYEGIVPVRMPDGSWHVDLDERFMMFSVAQRSPGGGIHRGCVHGPAGVAAWHASVLARSAPQPQVSAPAGVAPTAWVEQ